MLEQIFSPAAFIWLSIGTGIGLFIAALMRELVERATVIRMRKEKGLSYDNLY